jgi:hypothetical protein
MTSSLRILKPPVRAHRQFLLAWHAKFPHCKDVKAFATNVRLTAERLPWRLAVAYAHGIRARLMSLVLSCSGLRNSQPAAIDRHQEEHPVAWLSGRSQDRFHLTARVDFRAPGGAAPTARILKKSHQPTGEWNQTALCNH